ncbi:MAG: hypothetical protein ABI565_07055 [Vicinamibacteria bacterium]
MRTLIRRWPRVSVFLLGLGWMFLLEERFRNEAAEHLYFQAWTSEYMMQTLSVGDLRLEPFKSLWYNHIQPPMFDAIRAALAALYPNANGEALMRRVDTGLYGLWMFVYAATAVLVFSWISRVRGPRSAVLCVLVFLLLPGPIFYATFLDSTLVSSTLILWFFWALWRFGRGEAVSVELVLVSVLLFFTRSVFQWPFLVVLAASLWLMATPRVRALRVLVPICVVMIAFLAKQYVLFGLTTTSSFGPDSFCKGLSEYCHGTTAVDLPKTTDRFNAFVLRRAEKLNGEYNYNQEAFLKRSFSQMEEYKALLRRLTPGRVFELLKINLNFYLRPTSRHSSHVIVDRLPWRRPFEFLLSGWSFVALLVLSIASWLHQCWKEAGPARRSSVLHGLGLALPAIYVAAVTILFESGENMRYRFFLEPTLFVFFWMALSGFFPARPAKAAS